MNRSQLVSTRQQLQIRKILSLQDLKDSDKLSLISYLLTSSVVYRKGIRKEEVFRRLELLGYLKDEEVCLKGIALWQSAHDTYLDRSAETWKDKEWGWFYTELCRMKLGVKTIPNSRDREILVKLRGYMGAVNLTVALEAFVESSNAPIPLYHMYGKKEYWLQRGKRKLEKVGA